MTNHEKNCLIKKVWGKYTPYIQMGGWLIIVCGGIMTFFATVEQVRAFDNRLSSVEQAVFDARDERQDLKGAIKNQNEKLDLVIQLLRKK